jgi:hypothetical protein
MSGIASIASAAEDVSGPSSAECSAWTLASTADCLRTIARTSQSDALVVSEAAYKTALTLKTAFVRKACMTCEVVGGL